MANDRIRVAGYSQKITYGNGIEYRNFSPDLVGLQLASDGGTPLMTMGNFSITTNTEGRVEKKFITNSLSNFITLSDLDLTLDSADSLLRNNAGVILNLDKKKLTNYALFGSLTEFVRVSLEDIITKWPASLYVDPNIRLDNPLITKSFDYTIEDYSYDTLTDSSSFKISTNVLVNKFLINFTTTGSIENTFSETNNLRNMIFSYASYVILINNIEYDVLGFTAATDTINDYIYLTVKGDPFNSTSVNLYTPYHIKPNKLVEETFYNSLPDFEYYLLNRLVEPKYTAEFKFPIKSELGAILYVTETITWPTTDGYNIDYDTSEYINYVSKLLNIATNSDLNTTNLVNRFLVTESISAFDTLPFHLADEHQDTSGGKMTKTLQIYGRSFDEFNNYITGIAFANTVSYDKLDNTPDIYLKNLAKVMGWDLISSVLEENLLKSYVSSSKSTYSGQSVGLTPVEADIELWRRLILNTPWLWKSKGSRKAIEFLFKFIGAPNGLITFNEYIYVAENPIDVDLFTQTLQLSNLSDDLTDYPIDSDGYPNPFPNTSTSYYQNNGLWYRQTAGLESNVDILVGNNPHVGPYDGGFSYINQFKTLIPNFSGITITSETVTNSSTNLYTNYNLGTFDQITTPTTDYTVNLTNDLGEDLSDCFVFTSTITPDVKPGIIYTDCGCPCEGNDNILSLCIDKKDSKTQEPLTCDSNKIKGYDQTAVSDSALELKGDYPEFVIVDYYQYLPNGDIYTYDGVPVLNTSFWVNPECCKSNSGKPSLYYDNGDVNKPGYVCCKVNSSVCGCKIACKWQLQSTNLNQTYTLNDENYLVFLDEAGDKRVTTVDGSNCLSNYTQKIQITDPYTNEIGIGCKLTTFGQQDIELTKTSSIIIQTYNARFEGEIQCCESL
jgi:hypothetical protein